MRSSSFSITTVLVFVGVVLGLGAFAGNINLPEQNTASRTLVPVDVITHETRAASEDMLQLPNPSEITPEIESDSSAPATRSTFMATWDAAADASGYRAEPVCALPSDAKAAADARAAAAVSC